jgi:sensor histidine kinase YesM
MQYFTGMWLKEHYFKDRYQRLALAFFVIYFICFPILTGIEYYVYEPVPNKQSFLKNLPEQLMYGFTAMIPAWVCYQFIIKKLLFEKRYLWFVVALLAYLVLHQCYRLVIYRLIAQLHFLPNAMVQHAARWYANGKFYHVISIYELRDLMVLSALAYFIRSARQDKLISALQQHHLESELNFLKMQIQPHFFFNTLNNIYALALQGSEKAAPLVARHSDSMRYILYESPKQRVSLKQEVAFLQNFVEVEAMHFSNKADISFETQGITDHALIEPLLLLPFIENAFKHGLREETGEGFVHIIISQVENELFAEIRNSKPLQLVKAKPGIGLQNVLKRLEMLYPYKHDVDITENNSIFEVRINLILALQ